MMKRINKRSVALTLTLMLAFATMAMAAPKSERARKYINIEGRVLQVNQKARTLLVDDYWSKKLYFVTVPEGRKFRITFGTNMKTSEPEFWQVHRNDRVSMRCIRPNTEHLARLEDGREVVVVTAH